MMYQRVRSYVKKHHMLEQSDMVITGVSGGADSICLLFMLFKLQEEIGFSLVVVHVHHGLRGKDADADAEFVRRICKEQGVPFELYYRDVRACAEQRKLTEEEAGREARREAFADAMTRYHGTRIALAHHMNDNVETLMLNLCRGTGIRGAGGMAPASGIWIRPLLCLKRTEIESYLAECGISYCTDQTNLQDYYTRNKVRNHIIPYLENEVNSAAVPHISETMEQLRALCAYIEGEAGRYESECIEALKRGRLLMPEESFAGIPDAVKPYVVHRVICRAAGRQKDIESVHVKQTAELMNKQVGRQIQLPYGLTALRSYRGIEFFKNDGRDIETLSAARMRMRRIEKQTDIVTFPESLYTKWFDYDIIKNTVKLRHREPGDYLTIDKNGSTQKLKQYFINEKIPREERDRIWLVADGHHIMWIVGYRQSQMYQVTSRTKTVLEIVIDGGERNGGDCKGAVYGGRSNGKD